MIDVLITRVDEVLGVAEHCASEEDRRAAFARANADARRRTLAGRAALRLLAAWRCGVPRAAAQDIAITRSCPDCAAPHGRPVSEMLALSSSTSGAHVLVAVADAHDAIGVDIETVPPRLWPHFDAYALHERERAALPAAGTAPGRIARIQAWALKEAALKASGSGLRTAPAAVRFDAAPGADSGGWLRVHGAPSAGRGALDARPIPTDGTARAALASDRPGEVLLHGLNELLGRRSGTR